MINELMKRLSELPNVTMDDGQEYIQLYDAMETVKRALEQEPNTDVLDKIKAEIEQEYKVESEHPYGQGLRRALEIIDKYRKRGERMTDCYDCKYAIGDYEEYYGGYRQHIVVGCKLDRDPDTCGEEDDEDEMPEMRK